MALPIANCRIRSLRSSSPFSARWTHLHFCSVGQPVEIVRRDHVALVQAVNFRHVAIGDADGDGMK